MPTKDDAYILVSDHGNHVAFTLVCMHFGKPVGNAFGFAAQMAKSHPEGEQDWIGAYIHFEDGSPVQVNGLTLAEVVGQIKSAFDHYDVLSITEAMMQGRRLPPNGIMGG